MVRLLAFSDAKASSIDARSWLGKELPLICWARNKKEKKRSGKACRRGINSGSGLSVINIALFLEDGRLPSPPPPALSGGTSTDDSFSLSRSHLISPRRYQTPAQKIVQARMWAQGLTIGLLIVAGALTHSKHKPGAHTNAVSYLVLNFCTS